MSKQVALKNIVLQAIQWNGKNHEEIREFTNNNASFCEPSNSIELYVPANEDYISVYLDNYIIDFGNGYYTTIVPTMFETVFASIQSISLYGNKLKNNDTATKE